MIGTLGDIVFRVNGVDDVLTWQAAQTTNPSRWVEHEPIAQSPVSEFLGVALQGQTFSIYLSADLGINPAAFVAQLDIYRRTGEVLAFVVGDTVIGSGNGWVVLSFDDDWTETMSNGRRTIITVSLNLKEYGNGN